MRFAYRKKTGNRNRRISFVTLEHDLKAHYKTSGTRAELIAHMEHGAILWLPGAEYRIK